MASSSVDSSTAVYFITGANRGIGYGITERLAARPNVLIYAAARDPSRADKLQQLTARFSTVRIVRLSVESDADHAAAVEQVEAEAGRVDIVLANAGTSKRESYQRTEVLRLDLLRECFEVNTVGPLRLFQAFFPLLGRSTDPKFVVLSTGVASIAFQARLPDFPVTCYGTSKAAVNFVTERIHVEHPNITAFPLSPGWVQTEIGNTGAAMAGMRQAPLTVEQSVRGIVRLLDESARETHSGRFWNAENNEEMAW